MTGTELSPLCSLLGPFKQTTNDTDLWETSSLPAAAMLEYLY